jgi:hypothetical protein
MEARAENFRKKVKRMRHVQDSNLLRGTEKMDSSKKFDSIRLARIHCSQPIRARQASLDGRFFFRSFLVMGKAADSSFFASEDAHRHHRRDGSVVCWQFADCCLSTVGASFIDFTSLDLQELKANSPPLDSFQYIPWFIRLATCFFSPG